MHLELGGGPLQQPGGRRFSGPCSGAAAAPARGHRAGSSGSWSPCGELLVLGSLRPWLVVAGEGGGCSGGRRPRVAARVARGGAGRAAARGGVGGVGQQGPVAMRGGMLVGCKLGRILPNMYRICGYGPIRPSSRIRPGYVSLAYPWRIRVGYVSDTRYAIRATYPCF